MESRSFQKQFCSTLAALFQCTEFIKNISIQITYFIKHKNYVCEQMRIFFFFFLN